jgi:hypothetical protein
MRAARCTGVPVGFLILLCGGCAAPQAPPPGEAAFTETQARIRGFEPGFIGCEPLALNENIQLLPTASGRRKYRADQYVWSDARCQPRAAGLARNDRADPEGSHGGFLRELTWHRDGVQVVSRGTGVDAWNGFGYVVSHWSGEAALSRDVPGAHRTVFLGRHHAIHEFTVQLLGPGGPIDVTIHWLFATGRSHPVYAITHDSRLAGVNANKMDARAPYGDFAFEGGSGKENIGGVSWGDKYRFATLGEGPVTENSDWSYTQSNAVPHARLWTTNTDAEMGLVQTNTFERQVGGGDYILSERVRTTNCWGKSSASAPGCSAENAKMPDPVVWPFQINQWQLFYDTSNSHRLAWGSTFGTVGQASVSAFGKTISGYPFFSYSVFVVVDAHSKGPTLAQATTVERSAGAQLTATEGSVALSGMAGVGRPDAARYSPDGYNAVYSTWEVHASSGKATATLHPAAGPIAAPMFHFTGFTASKPSQVTLNGVPLVEGVDYFSSVDSQQKALWLTLNGTVTQAVTLHIE